MSDLAGYRQDRAGHETFDEVVRPDGELRPGWNAVVDALGRGLANGGLARADREGVRLMSDHGVTFVPQISPNLLDVVQSPDGDDVRTGIVTPTVWRLDPIPAVFGAREWGHLAEGVAQRTRLLDAVLADLYGPRRLMAEGLLPAAAILDHPEYLRPAVGGGSPSQLVLHAVDLGRDAAGAWVVMSDRTQAPSGAGYALMNRRATSRVLTDVASTAPIVRLSPFFAALRRALTAAAPEAVADPRVVVLSPGPLSETAYDQALLAGTLGFPLVEGSDLTVRDGRVYMRALGIEEPVDVIWRRIDSQWADALELRAGSRLGVAGLMDCVRRGTVSVVNSVGSGVLENPALMPFLPRLCQELLGENLKLGSVPTWWCGDEASRSHVLAHLDSLVIRTTSRSGGRGVRGEALTPQQRDILRARIQENPQRYVGQEKLPLSTTPTAAGGEVVSASLSVRAFCVRDRGAFFVMDGGLARPELSPRGDDDLVVTRGGAPSKDIWILREEGAPHLRGADRDAVLRMASISETAGMVPRVLSDLHWLGRYTERGEALARMLLAAPMVLDGATRAGRQWRSPSSARYFEAITHVTGAYPGMLAPGTEPHDEMRTLLKDPKVPGSVAETLRHLVVCAQGVRDRLSDDVWLVLAAADRALEALPDAGAPVTSIQLQQAGDRALRAFLALAGVVGDNMVHDPGWRMLDAGRGLERAGQVVRVLRATLAGAPVQGEQALLDAVMTACESIVTLRQRYPGRRGAAAVLELMLRDPRNPRGVAFQLDRIADDLGQMPGTAKGSRPIRLAQALADDLAAADPTRLATVGDDGVRDALDEFLASVAVGLREVSSAIDATYLKRPPAQRSMSGGVWETPE